MTELAQPPALPPKATDNVDALDERLRGALEAHGLRFTQQRYRVYEYLSRARLSGWHPTAEQVFQGIKPVLPSISLATVYKALEALAECGLILKIHISTDSAHYDFRTDPHHHAHCLDSGTIFDVECDSDAAILESLDLPAGFRAERVTVDVEGFCADCGEDHSAEVARIRARDAARAEPDENPSLRRALEEQGLRFTRQRRFVYDYMVAARATNQHPRAEEVFQGVKAAVPSISLATVYKSLEALEACGLLKKMSFGDGSAHYDWRTERHHHAHCQRTGRLFDVESKDDEAILAQMRVPEGFVVASFHVEVEGVGASAG